jgi:hypothetical protein
MEPLYIQVVNGQPVNHPAFENNLIEAFGTVPDDWVPFTRVERPTVSLYQVIDPPEPKYEFVNGVWYDNWTVRDMTDAEKSAKQQPIKDAWAARPYASNFAAWVYDEATNSYKPPIPRPTDGLTYRWSGAENNWKLAPDMPKDGTLYSFNFDSWAWEPMPQGT